MGLVRANTSSGGGSATTPTVANCNYDNVTSITLSADGHKKYLAFMSIETNSYSAYKRPPINPVNCTITNFASTRYSSASQHNEDCYLIEKTDASQSASFSLTEGWYNRIIIGI